MTFSNTVSRPKWYFEVLWSRALLAMKIKLQWGSTWPALNARMPARRSTTFSRIVILPPCLCPGLAAKKSKQASTKIPNHHHLCQMEQRVPCLWAECLWCGPLSSGVQLPGGKVSISLGLFHWSIACRGTVLCGMCCLLLWPCASYCLFINLWNYEAQLSKGWIIILLLLVPIKYSYRDNIKLCFSKPIILLRPFLSPTYFGW